MTQPVCDRCFIEWVNRDGVEPVRARGDTETCVHCGERTNSGIYIRVDPEGAFARYPTLA